jgi:NAD(P)H-flavin reductase
MSTVSTLDKQTGPTEVLDPMLPQPYRIEHVWEETYDTFTLELKPTDGVREFPFTAGQFNMLYVFGVGEVPISISGDPTRPATLVHTIRAVGTVTQAMRRLERGDTLGVRGPFGSYWPVGGAVGDRPQPAGGTGKDVVIVAGGIGLAPLRPALYHILAHRDQYGQVSLLYGARTPQDLLYQPELHQWRGRFDLQVEVTVDSTTDDWHGHVGVVTTLIPRARFDPRNTVALVCGPEIMMRFTILELRKRDLAPENIFISMERNMKCAIGFCGHCQFGPTFICKDGPVFRFDQIQWLFGKQEI